MTTTLHVMNALHPLVDTTPQAPPGTSQIATIIKWVAWGVGIMCFLGFLGGVAYLAVGALTGRETHGLKAILCALVAAVLLGAAGAIIGAVAHV